MGVPGQSCGGSERSGETSRTEGMVCGQQPQEASATPRDGPRPSTVQHLPASCPGPHTAGTIQAQRVSTNKRHLLPPSGAPVRLLPSLTRCHPGRREGRKRRESIFTQETQLT